MFLLPLGVMLLIGAAMLGSAMLGVLAILIASFGTVIAMLTN